MLESGRPGPGEDQRVNVVRASISIDGQHAYDVKLVRDAVNYQQLTDDSGWRSGGPVMALS
jgi:hypothetical protein